MTAQVTALTMILPAVLTQKRTREVTKGGCSGIRNDDWRLAPTHHMVEDSHLSNIV